MSVQVRHYKEVLRGYFDNLREVTNDDIDLVVMQNELIQSGFYSFNQHIIWWRIVYGLHGRILRIDPIG